MALRLCVKDEGTRIKTTLTVKSPVVLSLDAVKNVEKQGYSNARVTQKVSNR